MKDIQGIKRSFCLHLLLVPVLFLPGCFEKDEKETPAVEQVADVADGSEVLMKIDGKSRITLKSLDDEFNRLLEESPQLKQVLPFMPDAKLNFFQGMVSQEVIDEYVRREGIDSSSAFQNELAKTIEQVRRILNQKYFSERHPAQVTDAEVKKFYEENKDKLPDLLISQGGVKAEGVSFAKEEDAQAFLAKLKETKQSVEQLARQEGVSDNYRDFKLVNNQSTGIDPALRVKIVSIKSLPGSQQFTVGDLFWVVQATEKKESQYRPLDQVKPNLEEYLKKQKQMEIFEKAIDSYKKTYNVETNEEPLRPKPEDARPHQLSQMEVPNQEIEVAQTDQKTEESPATPAPTQSV